MAAWNPFLKPEVPRLHGGSSLEDSPSSKVWVGDHFPHKLAKGTTQFPKTPQGVGAGSEHAASPTSSGSAGFQGVLGQLLGNCLKYPPSGDYFNYHPQARRRKGGEKQGWCQDTCSRAMGSTAALSFDFFSCNRPRDFTLAGLVPEKGVPGEGRVTPAPGGSPRHRDAQALSWGGQEQELCLQAGEPKKSSNDFLCVRRDRRGDKSLDVAEGHKKSAGEYPPPPQIYTCTAFTHLLNHKLAVQKGSKDCCGPK